IRRDSIPPRLRPPGRTVCWASYAAGPPSVPSPRRVGCAPETPSAVNGAETVSQSISAVALVVDDYDEAVAFFAGKLGFEVAEDTPLPGGKRWLLVRPRGGGMALLLARAATPEQAERIGDQAGGRVFLFLHTDDFWRDYHNMQSRGVHFTEEP